MAVELCIGMGDRFRLYREEVLESNSERGLRLEELDVSCFTLTSPMVSSRRSEKRSK